MTISELIARTGDRPLTQRVIAGELRMLGVQEGMTLLVHSSLSSLGWVNGGTQAVIAALQQVLGPTGTLMMPTHTGDLSDPANWCNPPVPEEWWDTIRETMPAYDPAATRTFGMGALPEAFRAYPGVHRSAHPQFSFAAYGPEAERLTAGHELPYGLGEQSPLARLYELGGYVLLIGVGHDSNTSLHLAEYRGEYSGKRTASSGAPVINREGKREWAVFDDVAMDSDDFVRIGAEFEAACPDLVQRGQIGLASSLLTPQRPLVDYAAEWMKLHRQETPTKRY
ncbi:aminoglycoside N(3)-acetyltransferase [Paenibacillus lutrae]|uniref:Aminoglycoside N(3)-acetyltransferase n=1 Tax=Paenibacillus lutrae TaxID=2078573 RepID=A0A7X3JY34_9BACL|nr:AAC(3) family N-acetyltransferase [Paenibacillus lutrae]MVO98582.1 aminoglycoside N(3)-acetyltransferase [Paenibacillus lutrae]